MINRNLLQARFVGLFSWLGIVGIAGGLLGMELNRPASMNLGTDESYEWKPVVFVDGNEMDWTSKPHVQSVTQNKGTVLMVRSDLYEIIEGKPLTIKTIAF